ncbi:MAG: 7TM-DISM domain-containing protein, partial [Treponema sp.]|nr:7TM-DISM domain-containing protein [Treponema sp.]
MKRVDLYKYLIPAFYAVVMALVIFHAWNGRSSLRKGGSSALYRNLMDSPAWIRKGFDHNSILQMPTPSSEWVQFETSPPRVMNAPLPDLPKRTFFSPMGRKAEEFTIIIPVEMDGEAIAHLNQAAVLPGIYFAHIGENWEIYINGNLVQSEMHLDKTGQPRTRRNWRGVFFPVNNSYFVTGTNILALRIVGDPTYRVTGLSYTSPHYMDEYRFIEKRNRNFLYTALCGIFGFVGVYFLLLFLFMRKKDEGYYLWFSLYSILLGVYAVTRGSIINTLIPGSEIAKRLEYFSLMLTVPMFGLFIETLWR